VEPSHTSYAGLVSRVGALAIDVVVLTLGSLLVGGLPVVAWQRIMSIPAPQWLQGITFIAAATLPWLYFTGFWWLNGQTPGDIVTGITVRRMDGGELSFLHAAVRAAGGLLLVPLWLVGLLSVLWDPRRMAWHDHVFRTVVRYADTMAGARASHRSA
jgi:uncharacterized RDD family membrane protein YckC